MQNLPASAYGRGMTSSAGPWAWVAGTISALSLVAAVALWVVAATARHNGTFVAAVGLAAGANGAFFAWQVGLARVRARDK